MGFCFAKVYESETLYNLCGRTKMKKKTVMVWAYVNQEIRRLVENIAGSKGISISEYIRQLVIQDLDRRSVFTTMLKESSANE